MSISNYLNINESKFDQSQFQGNISEDELYRHFSEYLENSKKSIDEYFLNKTEDEFIEMMKEKGYTLHNQNKSAERSSKNKNSNNDFK